MEFKLESTNWSNKDELLGRYGALLSEFDIRREVSDRGPYYDELYITFNNLDELMHLVGAIDRNIGIILFGDSEVYDNNTKQWIPTGIPMIEIYDGYRE